jgi:hypothetical protein
MDDVVLILLKTGAAILIANVMLIVLMLTIHIREERQKARIRKQKEQEAQQSARDDRIFEEVGRFNGISW